MAIDGEFDQHDKKSVLSKITLVDDQGLILLDTLVNPGVNIDYSCIKIHGINKDWLCDAPSVESVRFHILLRFKDSIFIGHGVNTDLKVLGLGTEISYIDTLWLN